MVNIFENLGLVNGTNAMTPLQVKQIGESLPNKDNISVLEFGAGTTTVKLYEAFKTKYDKVNYVTYEDNPKWAPNHKGIDVRLYYKKDLISRKLSIPSSEKYDIVIVDGPDGELRKYWFQIFKDNVKDKTIIHIDDVFHYPSFENELNSTFKDYDILFESGRKTWDNNQLFLFSGGPLGNILFRYGNNKCWLTIKLK